MEVANPNISFTSPGLGLLVKIGSIARHCEEAISGNGHVFDMEAVKSLLTDPEVKAWMEAGDSLAFLPVLR